MSEIFATSAFWAFLSMIIIQSAGIWKQHIAGKKQKDAVLEKVDEKEEKQNAKIDLVIRKVTDFEVTLSRVENDVKETKNVTKNTDFARKLRNKLESRIDYLTSKKVSEDKKQLLDSVVSESFKVFQYILDEDFYNITKEVIYSKLKKKAKYINRIIELESSIYDEMKNDIDNLLLLFSADIEQISNDLVNGKRQIAFKKKTLNLIDDIVKIVV